MSTYLLLLVIALMIINVFVYDNVKKSYISEKEASFVTQANILASRALLAVDESNNELNHLLLNQMMEEMSRLINGRILVIDGSKTIIYDSYNDMRTMYLEDQQVSRALKGESSTMLYHQPQYGKTMYVAVPMISYDKILGVVFLSVSLEEVYSRIFNVRDFLILISVVTLMLITFISLFLANVISEPIKKLTAAMQSTALGKLNQRVDIEGNDEIGQLSRAYNYMSTKLSHIDQQRSDFVANVSHELKTPLSSMKLLAESIILQPNTEKEIYREFLMDIDSEIDRLNDIIESLLAMVDLSEEKLNLNFELTYVNYLVEKVVGVIRPLAEKKDIRIMVNQWEKIQIYLDQGKVHQALINIIYNAVKYTDVGGRVIITITREGKYAVIKIMDNGIGIPEESLPYIFERFYRVDSARSRKTGGTGLGLSISKQIITLHQGVIEVESQLNVGTTFYIKLPMDNAPIAGKEAIL